MKTLKQEVHFDAKPQEVYEVYVDAKKHWEITGGKVVFEKKVGGKFSAWDGGLSGENFELVDGKKIVQKWRSDDWPEGHYSTLTIEVKPDGNGTKLMLTQENVPDDKADEIDDGWHTYYWKPMNEYFSFYPSS